MVRKMHNQHLSVHYLKIVQTRTGITLDTLASNRHNASSGFSIFKVPALRKKENKVQQYAWKEAAAAVNNKTQQQREGKDGARNEATGEESRLNEVQSTLTKINQLQPH